MKLSQFVFVSMLLSVNLTAVGCAQQESKSPEHQTPHVQTAQKSTGTTDSPLPNEKSTAESTLDSKSDSTPSTDSIALFDGKSLDGWEITNFGGERDCRAENGSLFIDAGDPLNGITSTRQDLPKTDFEISLEAKKISGIDFFCALTFPVADSHCTFVVGGWAGSVVGLSCIDEKDASRNETRKLLSFERNRWYKIKVRVQPKRIQAWIDDDQVVDQNIEGRTISLRNETLATRPLGICSFETKAEFRYIQLTILPASK